MTLRRAVLGGVVALAGGWAGRGRAAAAPVNLVFDGDSISRGFGSSPGHGLDARVAAALGDGVTVHNVSVGGRPVSVCLRLYGQGVVPLRDAGSQHNVIVFHGGDNDIAHGADAAATYAAFNDYVAGAHRDGWKVVVSTELRRYDFRSEQERELEDYNRRLRGNDAKAEAVVDLDSDPRLVEASYRRDPAIFIEDGVHPSDGGYAVLTGLLAPAVRRVAGR
jgi:lysophospholipase L1-like esterase